jgi:hypothetical protein
VIGAKAVGLLILSTVLTLPAGGQQPANGGSAPPHAQPAQKNAGQQPVGRLGEWLSAHKDLPLDQQEKLLESLPAFKHLTQQRQAELIARLRWFNGLPPKQKEKVLKNMKYLESLTPDQRKQVREAHQHMQTLPTERRVMVRKELRNLMHMPPDKRQEEFASDQFKTTFSDQEQLILRNLAEINPPAR